MGRGILPYQAASSSIQPFGRDRHGPKTGGCAPFIGELRCLYLHAKFHLDPSNRLATVRQRHRQTDRQDRQDNGPIA